MDRSPPDFVTGFYSGLASTHPDCVTALMQTLTIDEGALKKLAGTEDHYTFKSIGQGSHSLEKS